MNETTADRRRRLRWFAVMDSDRMGWPLDYYPEERARYLRALGGKVIGDFATPQEAIDAVFAELPRRRPTSRQAGHPRGNLATGKRP